ncbi:Putative transmembrane protein (PGPGW) [Nocardioides terrae]|uniref:Putative transmembrane protein (PGPGW) n=1 Tax=Nocardioides terrae TaxID=574651 RepID=A0A1I1F086_9ACTN|nr:PGPGW domain-containing protein [Nocardioides terrae]SFB92805.1 Putative transmembrane protein (PGPGW) [Nocardioides terrae]
MRGGAKRLVLEALGWLLVVAGIAALVLPGPGLLMLFAGLALLAREYEWARRRLDPVRLRALRGAADSVQTWPRILFSVVVALVIIGFGVLWLVGPGAPGWWPLPDSWWLLGGPWTGVTLEISGLLALALLVYSYRRFHHRPEARLELDDEINEADLER